jgi:hypothetical protein
VKGKRLQTFPLFVLLVILEALRQELFIQVHPSSQTQLVALKFSRAFGILSQVIWQVPLPQAYPETQKQLFSDFAYPFEFAMSLQSILHWIRFQKKPGRQLQDRVSRLESALGRFVQISWPWTPMKAITAKAKTIFNELINIIKHRLGDRFITLKLGNHY